MENKLRILILEDVPADAELVEHALRKARIAYTARRVSSKGDFQKQLEEFSPDIVLSDYSLPEFDGMAALRLAQEHTPNIPFIIVTGSMNEDTAVECMKAGAADYVIKQHLARLGPAIKGALEKQHLISEKELADAKLRESEEKQRTVLNNIDEVIYMVKTDESNPMAGTVEFISGRAAEIFGYTLADFRKDPNLWSSNLHPDDQEQVYKQTMEIYTAKRTGTRVYRMKAKKNGQYHWLEDRIVPQVDDKGKLIGIFGVARDITERKRAEEELKLFRTLIDKSNDAIEVVDPETLRILDVNEKACLNLGYRREELLSFTIGDIDPTFSKPQSESIRQKLQEHGFVLFETLQQRKDGSTFPVEINLRYVHIDRGYVVAIARDITERKKAEESLRKSEQKYKSFFEEDLTGDYISTLDGRIRACNPAFVRIFGFASMEEALGTNAATLYRDPMDRQRLLTRIERERRVEYHKLEMVRRDGMPLHIIANIIGRFDETGRPVELQGYLFDDTKRSQLEQQLIQAQKIEGLGTLAGGIAHDFNNILGIIMGHSSLLGLKKADPEKLSESIEAITKATQRGASLVKQLLTFARKTEALFESVNINDIIGEINKLLQETFPKTITVSTTLQQDLPAIVADASQIHQVLLNLCVNARDAMPKRGTLSISTRTIEGEAVNSRFPKATARQYVQIDVADTGIGMNEATRQRIFEPFFTTKGPGKGTGLGLAVVFGIVEHHSGFIDVRSAPGEGTSFTVYLPIPERAPEVSQRARKGVEEIAGGTETILLIEDEEMLRELVKAVLVSKGYTVLTAEDGMQGLEVFRSHQKEIAVVLSDMGLPMLSGQDVFRRIREINPQAKLILASGFIDPETKSEMYKAGAKHFIQKPYSHDEVLQKVREVIDRNG